MPTSTSRLRDPRWLLGACLVAGCAAQSGGGALDVVVRFGPGSRSQCVRVEVTGKSGAVEASTSIPRKGRPGVSVGVEPDAKVSGTVSVMARGFAAPDCSGIDDEHSNPVTASLDGPGVSRVTLMLDGPLGGDGGASDAGLDGGGSDAGLDGGCAAATETSCANGTDDDCDGLTDCADPDCNTRACDDHDLCTTGETCASGQCQGAPASCSDAGTCETASGATCDAGTCIYRPAIGAACGSGLFCRSDKTCQSGEANCLDGIDNDLNGLTDCADPACNLQSCDGGMVACFAASTCAGGACAHSGPVACAPLAGGCVTSPACAEPSGCVYSAVSRGSPCATGSCRSDGGCGPAESGALCADGLDNDDDGLTDCADPGCLAAACNDNNSCTSAETCLADAGCGGAMDPCDGGLCLPDGGCQPGTGSAFPYVPSNFDPSKYAAGDAGVVLNCGSAEINSGVAGGTLMGWCGGAAAPALFDVPQDGGEAALVAVMPALTVTSGGTLTLTGSRAIILAIYGDAVIQGKLLASASGGRPPAGASAPPGGSVKSHCGSAGTGSSGTSGGSTSGGGGGGGFGRAGARGGFALGSSTNAGVGGTANGAPALAPLRGGCAGGNGGSLAGAAAGGYGGGALQLSAAGGLTITGQVGAPGLAGQGGAGSGNQNAGGGGAGSGGGVVLEGRRVAILSGGFVTANGGSGGEGDADPGGGNDGVNGNNGHTNDSQAAVGGRSGSVGGDGGDGGTLIADPTSGETGANSGNLPGGGGGGGAVGRIRLFSAMGSCIVDGGGVSPAAQSGNCP